MNQTLVRCPLNPKHLVPKRRLIWHFVRCKKKASSRALSRLKKYTCPYNTTHWLSIIDYEEHVNHMCPDREQMQRLDREISDLFLNSTSCTVRAASKSTYPKRRKRDRSYSRKPVMRKLPFDSKDCIQAESSKKKEPTNSTSFVEKEGFLVQKISVPASTTKEADCPSTESKQENKYIIKKIRFKETLDQHEEILLENFDDLPEETEFTTNEETIQEEGFSITKVRGKHSQDSYFNKQEINSLTDSFPVFIQKDGFFVRKVGIWEEETPAKNEGFTVRKVRNLAILDDEDKIIEEEKSNEEEDKNPEINEDSILYSSLTTNQAENEGFTVKKRISKEFHPNESKEETNPLQEKDQELIDTCVEKTISKRKSRRQRRGRKKESSPKNQLLKEEKDSQCLKVIDSQESLVCKFECPETNQDEINKAANDSANKVLHCEESSIDINIIPCKQIDSKITNDNTHEFDSPSSKRIRRKSENVPEKNKLILQLTSELSPMDNIVEEEPSLVEDKLSNIPDRKEQFDHEIIFQENLREKINNALCEIFNKEGYNISSLDIKFEIMKMSSSPIRDHKSPSETRSVENVINKVEEICTSEEEKLISENLDDRRNSKKKSNRVGGKINEGYVVRKINLCSQTNEEERIEAKDSDIQNSVGIEQEKSAIVDSKQNTRDSIDLKLIEEIVRGNSVQLFDENDESGNTYSQSKQQISTQCELHEQSDRIPKLKINQICPLETNPQSKEQIIFPETETYSQKKNSESLIVKEIDLYQGFEVKKVSTIVTRTNTDHEERANKIEFHHLDTDRAINGAEVLKTDTNNSEHSQRTKKLGNDHVNSTEKSRNDGEIDELIPENENKKLAVAKDKHEGFTIKKITTLKNNTEEVDSYKQTVESKLSEEHKNNAELSHRDQEEHSKLRDPHLTFLPNEGFTIKKINRNNEITHLRTNSGSIRSPLLQEESDTVINTPKILNSLDQSKFIYSAAEMTNKEEATTKEGTLNNGEIQEQEFIIRKVCNKKSMIKQTAKEIIDHSGEAKNSIPTKKIVEKEGFSIKKIERAAISTGTIPD